MSSQRTRTPLDEIADAYVDRLISIDPFTSTYIGQSDQDHLVSDLSPAGERQRADLMRETLRQMETVPDVDDSDAVTRAAMIDRMGLAIEFHESGWETATVNNLASNVQIRNVLDMMPTETDEDWEKLASRMDGFPRALAGWTEGLREQADRGVISARRQLALAAEQARGYASANGFFASFAEHENISEAMKPRVTAAARAAAQAYRDLADVLDELQNKAPESDAVGRERYMLGSREFLGMTIDLEETYAWGIEELRTIIAEQEQLAREINERYKTGGGTNIEAAREALNHDPARILHGTDALRDWMQDLSDAAVAELSGTHFDIPQPLHHLECMIARTGSGGIYYTGPSEDLSRPGRMWWDVAPGDTEFRTWSETTTVYHEGVPGHHLQVGIQTLQTQNLNRWRALMCWVSGHGEGWALYAERLMEKLGYLDDPGDRMGMLDAQRMRAGRVVLDIGLHCGLEMPSDLPGARGGAWTYDSAWEFMEPNWGVRESERRFELHRYLGWPGQAPSYKLGQREWESLRADLVGDGDPREFHRRALELGSLPLSVLRGALS